MSPNIFDFFKNPPEESIPTPEMNSIESPSLNEKAQLMAVLGNMVDAVVAVDRQGKILILNKALCAIFQLNAEESKGKRILEVLRYSELNQLIQEILSDQKNRVVEIRAFFPEERYFEAHGAPLMVDDVCQGVLVVLHDITRIRQLEQIRRDFVANVSHELRTPLSSIKGYAETLINGGLEDEKNRTEFVEAIERQADQMTSLVEDLLDLAAIESGKRIPTHDHVSIEGLFKELFKSLSSLAQKKKVQLLLELDQKISPVRGDKNQLAQVFRNLLENAIKFNRENGVVRVFGIEKDGILHVLVQDTGIGIPSQDLNRVFERFYRVDKARSREMGGTGLGLSIVKHIVESHHGAINLESSIGKGSTFTISLPIYK